MKLKFRILLIFFIGIFSISYAFGEEDNGLRDKYVSKNIYYEFKDILPKIEEQIFICSDGSKIWLELTNFEFLVNSKESNNIIKVYIGNVSSGDKFDAIEKHPIEIFDPEAAFVFSDAVIRYWDSLSKDTAKDPFLELAAAIQAGYSATSYHFGFLDSLESKNDKPISSFKDLLEFCKSRHQKYTDEVKNINRLVTKEDIEKRKGQGFIAFYPNPVYLDDIVWYVRSKDMSYEDYIKKNKQDLKFDNFLSGCNKGYLSKYSDINFAYCDKYSRALERLYPDDAIYLNNTNKFHARDFKRISVYSFRGDHRTIDEIYDAGGFWTQVYPENEKKLPDDNQRLGMEICANRPCPSSQAYVSTSNILDVTKMYGKNVYALFAEGGFSLPSDFNGKKIYAIELHEIAVPGGIGWKNVVGARERIVLRGQKGKKFLIGPVFLKASLAENDRKNFWEILQIMGGKAQCSNTKIIAEITKNCLDLLNDTNKESTITFFKKLIAYYYRDVGLNDQEIEEMFPSIPKSDTDIRNIREGFCVLCQEVSQGALDLESLVRRR